MFERLDKIRAELAKAREKRDAADKKVKELEAKLKEAEASEVVDMVSKIGMTPEQLKKFLDKKNENGHGFVPPVQEKKESEVEKIG